MSHFCVECGSPLQPRSIEGRELEACDCGYVLWRDPKVVTMVVVETADGTGIVAGRRAIEPGYGRWCLPGGFVNDDEHPAASAARECWEEIGVEVEIVRLLGVYHIPKPAAPSMIGLGYVGRLRAGARAQAGAEMLEVAVFDAGALPELAFPSHVAAIADYLETRPQSPP